MHVLAAEPVSIGPPQSRPTGSRLEGTPIPMLLGSFTRSCEVALALALSGARAPGDTADATHPARFGECDTATSMAQLGRSHASGSQPATQVPPAVDDTSSAPPRASSRSRMFCSPPVLRLWSRAYPCPLSCTSNFSRPSARQTCTEPPLALACLAMF